MQCNSLYIRVTVYKYTIHVCHCCIHVQLYIHVHNTRLQSVCRCASFLLLYFFNLDMVTFTFGQGDQTGRRDLTMMMIGWDIIIQLFDHLYHVIVLWFVPLLGNHHTLVVSLSCCCYFPPMKCLHLQNKNLFSC